MEISTETDRNLAVSQGSSTDHVSLCSACKGLDIEMVFNSATTIKSRNGLFVASLAPESTSCALCKFFRTFQMPSSRTQEYHIRAFSVFKSYPGISYSKIPLELRDHDSVFLAVVPGGKSARGIQKALSHCWKTGFISLYPGPYISSQNFHGRRVSEFVDYALIKEWISYCERHHHKCRPSRTFVPDLHLIDCENDGWTIVPAPLFGEYIALSYVWGASTNVESSSSEQIANGKHALPPNHPKVVSDAIKATKELGKRFLWIDKYCINQEDKEKMQEAFNQMHLIYRGACATIFAAAGEDQGYGLAGVGNISRINQPIVHTLAGTLVSTLAHPMHSVESSMWSSRGWTYQEAVFSKRRLFFTEEQVYFECDSMNCYESLHTPMDLLHTKDKERCRHFMRSGIFSGTEGEAAFNSFDVEQGLIQPRFPQYATHLERYTARNLTHSYDSLNAFRGVMQYFQTVSISKIWQVWGLPFIPYRDLQTNSFAVSLTWYHQIELTLQKVHRIDEFPSWTWAGWVGKIKVPLAYVYRTTELFSMLKPDRFQHDITNVVLCRKDGTRKLLDNVQNNAQDAILFTVPNAFDHLLELEVHILQPHNLQLNQNEGSKWTIAGSKASMLVSISSISDEKFLQDVRTSRVSCVLLGRCCKYSYFMVVEWRGEISHRIGMISVENLSEAVSSILLADRRSIRLE